MTKCQTYKHFCVVNLGKIYYIYDNLNDYRLILKPVSGNCLGKKTKKGLKTWHCALQQMKSLPLGPRLGQDL